MKILKIRNRYNANVKMIRMEMKKLYFEHELVISCSLLNPIVFKKKERERKRRCKTLCGKKREEGEEKRVIKKRNFSKVE